jgi:hypothetical protein
MNPYIINDPLLSPGWTRPVTTTTFLNNFLGTSDPKNSFGTIALILLAFTLEVIVRRGISTPLRDLHKTLSYKKSFLLLTHSVFSFFIKLVTLVKV